MQPGSVQDRDMLRLLGRVVDVKREELPALGWTWLYFYAVLASDYVDRPNP